MLELSSLQLLVRDLSREVLGTAWAELGWSLRRLGTRIMLLDDQRLLEFRSSTAAVSDLVDGLATRARRGQRFTDCELRELTTLLRRLATTLEHVAAPAGPDRLEPADLQVEYATLDVAEIMRSAAAGFAPLAEQRLLDIRIQTPEHMWAEVDRFKLEMALGIALFSAIKQAPPGSTIGCRAWVDPHEPDSVCIRIEDVGAAPSAGQLEPGLQWKGDGDPGLAPVIRGRRFSLALARDLLSLHGGMLESFPAPSGRLNFEFHLPCRAPSGVRVWSDARPGGSDLDELAHVAERELRIESELEGRAPTAGDERPLVVVIDPSRPLHRSVVGILEPEYGTVSAFDAATGIRLVRRHRPDLVILDDALPDMDSERVGAALREVPGWQGSILVMTAARDEARIETLFASGVHDIVAKPLVFPELRARARRLLAERHTTDVLGRTLGHPDTDLVTLADEVESVHGRLARAHADLEAAHERTEAAISRRKSLVRVMSHELKTPITAIRLQLSVLEHDPGVRRTPALDLGLARIERSTGRLLNLVETILEWSRVEDGRRTATRDWVDLPALAKDVAEHLRGHAEARGVTIVVHNAQDAAFVVPTDATLIRLVLLNLVDRAIGVSQGGGVEVSFDVGADTVRIGIRDEGPLLRAEQFEALCNPLSATDADSRTGVGLGLHVVQTLAAAADGRILRQDDGCERNAITLELPSNLGTTDATL